MLSLAEESAQWPITDSYSSTRQTHAPCQLPACRASFAYFHSAALHYVPELLAGAPAFNPDDAVGAVAIRAEAICRLSHNAMEQSSGSSS